MNVTSDKVKNATVNGVAALQLSNNTALAAAKITTDSKGEATFTVSGANTAVTPVVFAPNTTTGEKAEAYKASALQTTAPKVTFSALQAQYTLDMTREGGEVAARYVDNGRQYKIIVKDKEGKLAKNEIVNVAFNEDLDGVISTNTEAKFIQVDKDDNQTFYPNTAAEGKNTAKQISVKTNDKGEATFVIGSDKENDYATPIAWIDINTSNAKQGKLDEGEPKVVGQMSYFQNAYLDGAAVKSYKPSDSKKVVTKFDGDESAVFRAELVNQSNKKMSGTSVKKVTYTIFNTGANDVLVDGKIISSNRSWTVTKELPGSTDLIVTSADHKTTSVKVTATGVAINTDGKDYAFTSKEATAEFTSKSDVTKEHTGEVVSISKNEIEFVDKAPITIKDAKFYALSGAEIIGADKFIKELESYDGVVVTRTEDKDGKITLRVVREVKGAAAIKVNADTKLVSAIITSQAGGTTAVASSSDTIIVNTDPTKGAVATPKLTIGAKAYNFNANAPSGDLANYKNKEDLVEKINKDTNVHGVTATADSAGIVLMNKKGEAFTYQVDTLASVYVNNGKPGVESSKQQVTFTFTSSVNVNVDEKVLINGTEATVTSVNGNKVVVEASSLRTNDAITTFEVKEKGDWKALKSSVTEKAVNLAGVQVK